jgi:hypothetical protein
MDGVTTFTAVVVVLGIVLHAAAVVRLRRTDPPLFANMGKPEPMHSDFSKSSWMFFDYMIRCHFLRQGDLVLAIIGILWYLCLVTAVGCVSGYGVGEP